MTTDIDIRDITDSVLTLHNHNARITTQLFNHLFKKAGCPLNATQYDLLRIIFIARKEDGTLPLIKDITIMDRTTAARNLIPLIKKGFLIIKHEKDKRKKPLQVTPQGIRLLKNYAKTYQDADKKATE